MTIVSNEKDSHGDNLVTQLHSCDQLIFLRVSTDFLDDDYTVVHCSAGVGRTGTFIGVYKLVSDYQDSNVTELDFKKVFLEMRDGRMKMVQKKEQYVYIAKCLAHFIGDQESLQ